VLAALVHSQQLCNGHAAHLADDIYIQPAVVGLCFRRCIKAAAIGAAIADGTHQAVHIQRFTIDGVLHPAADVSAQLFHNGKHIGHLAAAQRDAPELRDAVGNLRIQTGSADGGRKAKAGLHQIDAHRPTGQLGIQIQKLFLCTKGAQKIVAAAKGQTAHGCICIAIEPGERFVEGAVAAGSEDPQFFPALPGLLRSGIGQLPGMTGVICDLNGIFFRRKPCTRGGNIDLLRQRTGAIGLTGSWIQKKQCAHGLPPAILLLL